MAGTRPAMTIRDGEIGSQRGRMLTMVVSYQLINIVMAGLVPAIHGLRVC
jgi:hypothetical protein